MASMSLIQLGLVGEQAQDSRGSFMAAIFENQEEQNVQTWLQQLDYI